MHVVIFEPYPQGHRFTYVKHVINALSGLPIRLTLATSPGASTSEPYLQQLAPIRSSFEMHEAYAKRLPNQSKYRLAWYHAGLLAKAAADLRPDHLIMPSADGTLEMLGARRLALQSSVRTELEVMLMSTSWTYETPGSLKRRLKAGAWSTLVGASRVRTLHVIDPTVFRAYRALAPSIALRTELAPDPVESLPDVSIAEARRRLNLAESGRIISCVGGMDERKGVDLLINAFLAARTSPDDRLLLVGKQSAGIRAILANQAADALRAGRIITIDGYVTDEQMNLAMAAANLIGVVYRHHTSSSSILIRAAAQGRPVLTTDLGWMGETCTRFGLGRTCNIRDPQLLTEALTQSLDESTSFTPDPASQRFVQFHSIENAYTFWSKRLRERLRLPALPRHTWDWVLETARPLPAGEPRA